MDIGPTHGAEVGRQFLQDVIFLVEDDLLRVVDCDDDAAMSCIGRFRERLDTWSIPENDSPGQRACRRRVTHVQCWQTRAAVRRCHERCRSVQS